MKTRTKGFLACMLASCLAIGLSLTAFSSTQSNEVTKREMDNAQVAREAATQGMVLLENRDQVLPLKEKKIAMFGGGAVRTVRGGTGSGDPFNGGLSGGGDWYVNQSERYHINILKSFLDAGIEVTTEELLNTYAKGHDAQNQKSANDPMSTFVYPELSFTDEELSKAAEGTDTAVYVISRNAGEGADRSMTKMASVTQEDGQVQEFEVGDYELSDLEKENLSRVASAFDKVVVVLNVGGIMDTCFFEEIGGLDSLLLMGQAGQEGGNALLDVLTGKETPSGKVIATWAKNYSDYPASETFGENDGDSWTEYYNEGIYVGYRYFDTFGIEPVYPFGYGLSYTDFEMEVLGVEADAEQTKLTVKVTNTGSTYEGREVVQVYCSAPDGPAVERPYQELVAYAKTDLLAPGQSQELTLCFATSSLSCFDKEKAAYVLEPGTYYLRVGNSSRNTKVAASLSLEEEVVTCQVSHQMRDPEDLEEWSKEGTTPYSYEGEEEEKEKAQVISLKASDFVTQSGISPYEDEAVTTYTTDPAYEPVVPYESVELVEKRAVTLKDVYDGTATMEELVAQMDLQDLIRLNCGSGWGVANEYSPVVGGSSETVPGAAGETVAYEKYMIPSIVSADGPGGVRVKQEYDATNEVTGEVVKTYQFATAWPVHFCLAQTWDTKVLEKVGECFGIECQELGISTLLGPSLNIWRDPLCGRNFEYFGEDPVVAGTMAASITRGIQSYPGVFACLKHYAANNQEANRSGSNSIVSERALREIYLKGFEIAIREAAPAAIMTSYNQINGVPTGDDYDLCTDLARGEWGFTGAIMTDWNGGFSFPPYSMHAGNDLIMPGGEARAEDILKGLKDYEPIFDERGQVGLGEAMNFGTFVIYKAGWNDFTLSAEGSTVLEVPLGEGFTAEEKDGEIWVGGEVVYTDYRQDFSGVAEYHTPLTTDLASIREDGKAILYKGDYADNNTICLGDIQKSAIHNLGLVIRSNDMARLYGTEATSYTQERAELLTPYQEVVKGEVE